MNWYCTNATLHWGHTLMTMLKSCSGIVLIRRGCCCSYFCHVLALRKAGAILIHLPALLLRQWLLATALEPTSPAPHGRRRQGITARRAQRDKRHRRRRGRWPEAAWITVANTAIHTTPTAGGAGRGPPKRAQATAAAVAATPRHRSWPALSLAEGEDARLGRVCTPPLLGQSGHNGTTARSNKARACCPRTAPPS